MKERHTATRCMSFIMCVTILLLGKSSIIGEISVCIILDGIRQKIRIRKNADQTTDKGFRTKVLSPLSYFTRKLRYGII